MRVAGLSSKDQIVDFENTQDLINLVDIDANINLGGNQAFSFIGQTAFSSTAGQLRVYSQGGFWYVEGDVDGNGAAGVTIQVTTFGGSALLATDFVL